MREKNIFPCKLVNKKKNLTLFFSLLYLHSVSQYIIIVPERKQKTLKKKIGAGKKQRVDGIIKDRINNTAL